MNLPNRAKQWAKHCSFIKGPSMVNQSAHMHTQSHTYPVSKGAVSPLSTLLRAHIYTHTHFTSSKVAWTLSSSMMSSPPCMRRSRDPILKGRCLRTPQKLAPHLRFQACLGRSPTFPNRLPMSDSPIQVVQYALRVVQSYLVESPMLPYLPFLLHMFLPSQWHPHLRHFFHFLAPRPAGPPPLAPRDPDQAPHPPAAGRLRGWWFVFKRRHGHPVEMTNGPPELSSLELSGGGTCRH